MVVNRRISKCHVLSSILAMLFAAISTVVAKIPALALNNQYIFSRKAGLSWAERSVEYCPKAHQVVKSVGHETNNLVCFNLNFVEGGTQYYSFISQFSAHFAFYLGMATRFLESVGQETSFKGEVVWRIDDDATVPSSLVLQLTAAGVATIGHSIHIEFGDPSTYTALVPDFHFIQYDGFQELNQRSATLSLSFKEKLPMVFWAGSATGYSSCPQGQTCNNSCSTLPRYRMVRLAQNSQWLNCSITGTDEFCGVDKTILRAHGVQSERIDEREWLKYRGIIDIDGNVDAWGLRWRLASQSVVFRVRSNYVNHYSHLLREGVHYIEIDGTLDDLLSKTSIIARNDSQTVNYLQEMSERAFHTINRVTYAAAVKKTARALSLLFNRDFD